MSFDVIVAAAGQETSSKSKNFYAELLRTGMFSDLTLEVAGQRLKAHSAVLAEKSPQFARRIEDMKADQTITLYTENTILGVQALDIAKKALSYCYTGCYAAEPSLHDATNGEFANHVDMQIRMPTVIYMFNTYHKIVGLSERLLHEFTTAATHSFEHSDKKNICGATIKDILLNSATLVNDVRFMETIKQLQGLDLVIESSALVEILMKWLTVQAAATANGDSIIIGSEGKPPLLSSWKCSRCGTVLYVDQTKETSPEACHRPCPYCPATTGQDMSQGLTLSLTRWECTCGAVWLTNSIQTQADVLPA